MVFLSSARADKEGGTGGPESLNSQAIGFLRNTGQDQMKNHEASKPAFNVGQSAFRWRANDGPLLV